MFTKDMQDEHRLTLPSRQREIGQCLSHCMGWSGTWSPVQVCSPPNGQRRSQIWEGSRETEAAGGIICGSSLKIGTMNVNRIAAGGGRKVKTILFSFTFTSREDQCVHLMSKNLHRNEWTKRPEQGEPTHGGRFWKRQGARRQGGQ